MTELFDRRLKPSPQAMETRVGEETVILHTANDTYYGLDAVGTRIWGMLREGDVLPEIRDRLAADYRLEPELVEADMRTFLSALLAQDLLVDA